MNALKTKARCQWVLVWFFAQCGRGLYCKVCIISDLFYIQSDNWEKKTFHCSLLVLNTRRACRNVSYAPFILCACADLNAHSGVWIATRQTEATGCYPISAFYYVMWKERETERETGVGCVLGFNIRTCCATSARWLIRVQVWWRSRGGTRERGWERESRDEHKHSSGVGRGPKQQRAA